MFEKLEALGNRRYALPFVLVTVVFCMMSLVVYPMLRATPKDVPFAVASLDAGMVTPAGTMNLGDEFIKRMTAGTQLAEGQESPIAWTRLDSESAVEEAVANNDFYGALVIPANFTAAQAAASTGAGEAPVVRMIINQGKNPMIATTMQSALTGMLDSAGIKTELEIINSANIGGGAMAALMAGQMIIMPLIMMTLACTILIFLLLRPAREGGRQAKAMSIGRQIGFAIALSAVIALFSLLIVAWVGGMTIPAWTTFLFLWFACLCIILVFLGALNLFAPLGALFIAICFSCGMATAMLAKEMLPGFWRDWIYPWVPQRFVADGIKSIFYMGGGAWNSASLALLITGCVGLVLMALAVFIPRRKTAVTHD